MENDDILKNLSKEAMLPWPKDPAYFRTAIMYGSVLGIGFFGNLLVVVALLHRSCLPDKKEKVMTMSFLLKVSWSGGDTLCKVAYFIQLASATSSILNLTAVTIERYAVIVHPIRSKHWYIIGNVKKIILLVWFAAFSLAIPNIFVKTEVTYNYTSADDNSSTVRTYSTCSDGLEGGKRQALAWYQFGILFLLPIIVIIYCYTFVIKVLWVSTKMLKHMTQGENENCRQRLTQQTSRRRHLDQASEAKEGRKQVIKLLLAIVLIYAICWGPYLALELMKAYELTILHANHAFEATIVIILLPMIQSTINPIVYSFMSKNFRQSVKSLLRFGFSKKKQADRLEMDATKGGPTAATEV
ncbi:DgyrCDS1139 [Dimorphilus gyrociliatus]|uniref:DgyrCDS1139 n=1 Tax=Dimorphilus gyrociliatus TaxID=2664684 RepID=A0A7I8V6P4_9ANNE|nr:DgyrCDS1139 [Dimorphilus gyrociliatus]